MAYRDGSDYSSGEAPLDDRQPDIMIMQCSSGVRLSALQTTALDVLNKVMLPNDAASSPDTTREIATLQRLAPPTQTIGAIRLGRSQDEMMLGSWHEDVAKELLKDLPKVITPEFKNNLRILAEFDKAGANATDEQRAAALAAYNGVGKTVSVALLSTLISYGIRTSLAETKAAPVSGVIARLLSEPLAKMCVEASGAYKALQRKIINIALKRMGKEPSDDPNQNMFIARLIGKFSGSLLAEIESRETHSLRATPRGPSYTQHAEEEAQLVGSGVQGK